MTADTLRFLKAYEVYIYLALGLVALYFLRRFILAWQELRGAGFGLERESAQGRLNQATITLVLLLAAAIAEFSTVSFIVPTIPEAQPLLTPTLNLLATPTFTLAPLEPAIEGTPGLETPTPEEATPQAGGCLPGQIEITAPKDGDTISGGVEIRGTVDVIDFGFYKFEMKHPQDTSWLTILAGNEIKKDTTLGTWNTSLLAAGEYQLSLVVVDNKGKPLPGCTILVRIQPPQP